MFKISASVVGVMDMCSRMRACKDEFPATVTEGIVHDVYKVVSRSSFDVTQRHNRFHCWL